MSGIGPLAVVIEGATVLAGLAIARVRLQPGVIRRACGPEVLAAAVMTALLLGASAIYVPVLPFIPPITPQFVLENLDVVPMWGITDHTAECYGADTPGRGCASCWCEANIWWEGWLGLHAGILSVGGLVATAALRRRIRHGVVVSRGRAALLAMWTLLMAAALLLPPAKPLVWARPSDWTLKGTSWVSAWQVPEPGAWVQMTVPGFMSGVWPEAAREAMREKRVGDPVQWRAAASIAWPILILEVAAVLALGGGALLLLRLRSTSATPSA